VWVCHTFTLTIFLQSSFALSYTWKQLTMTWTNLRYLFVKRVYKLVINWVKHIFTYCKAIFSYAYYTYFTVRSKIRIIRMVALWSLLTNQVFKSIYGHLIEWGRPLYFCLVVFIFFLSSIFFSSPNLSRRRLDVYHTSTHGVALVRI